MPNVLFVLFARQQIHSFVDAHRREDGWKVYHLCTNQARNLYRPYLADCLRDKHPGAVKLSSIAKEANLDQLLGMEGKSHAIEAGSQRDLREELDADGWIGSIEIEWNGSPIHFCSVFMDQCLAAEPLAVIAAKSNASLRAFLKVLSDYGIARESEKREILVVNGDDLPIPQRSWDDVVLPGGLAEEVRRNIEGFFKSAEKYQKLGLPFRRLWSMFYSNARTMEIIPMTPLF